MARVIILMLDSFGIGGAKDAVKFGDEGANTLLHIAQTRKHLNIPNMSALGLLKAAKNSCGVEIPVGEMSPSKMTYQSKYGFMREVSKGKDTSSGHWEMAGVPVLFKWGYFPAENSFPKELIDNICKEANLPGILGNKAASGTEIIKELGAQHLETEKPICYTSADSVFQIAAHEENFGLERLYKVCEIAFKYVRPYNIARVIARPFVGNVRQGFTRTKNRHDYSVIPPKKTLLDRAKAQNKEVIGIGKIPDIFANCGITKAIKASGLEELFNATLQQVKDAPQNSIIFTNFVDFDMVWGHRRDVEGYAKGLEYFDSRLPELESALRTTDVVFITADHGCDPTYKGTDHTRENVPVLAFGPYINAEDIGERQTFADLGQSAAYWLRLDPLDTGINFL